MNTLVERGLVGMAGFMVLLIAWFVSLARAIPQAQAPPLEWTYWGGAASAWMIAVVVGGVNTTLHHEHALLSVMLLGGWFGMGRRGESVLPN